MLLRCFPRKGEQTGFGFFSALSIFYEWVGRVGGGEGGRRGGGGVGYHHRRLRVKLCHFGSDLNLELAASLRSFFFTVMNFLF